MHTHIKGPIKKARFTRAIGRNDLSDPRAVASEFRDGKSFVEFINAHERIFVIEQNRDAQFKSLMMIELGINSEKLVSVLNYDGTPITADEILNQIKRHMAQLPV